MSPMEIKKVSLERRIMELREESKDLDGFRAQYPKGEILTVTVGEHVTKIYADYLPPEQVRGFCGSVAPGYIVPYGFLTNPSWVRVYSLTHLIHDFDRITVEQFLRAIDLPERKAILDQLLKRGA